MSEEKKHTQLSSGTVPNTPLRLGCERPTAQWVLGGFLEIVDGGGVLTRTGESSRRHICEGCRPSAIEHPLLQGSGWKRRSKRATAALRVSLPRVRKSLHSRVRWEGKVAAGRLRD